MSGDTIPIEKSVAKWRKNADYVDAYDALADEFALAEQIIGARESRARLNRTRKTDGY